MFACSGSPGVLSDRCNGKAIRQSVCANKVDSFMCTGLVSQHPCTGCINAIILTIVFFTVITGVLELTPCTYCIIIIPVIIVNKVLLGVMAVILFKLISVESNQQIIRALDVRALPFRLPAPKYHCHFAQTLSSRVTQIMLTGENDWKAGHASKHTGGQMNS